MTRLDGGFLALAGGGGEAAVRARFHQWCRGWSAKDLARDLGCEVRTATSWRAWDGPMPTKPAHLAAMVDRWGIAFLEFVFAPVLAESDLSVARRLERVEADIKLIREDLGTGATRQDAVEAAAKAHGAARRGLNQQENLTHETNGGPRDGADSVTVRRGARAVGWTVARLGRGTAAAVVLGLMAVGVQVVDMEPDEPLRIARAARPVRPTRGGWRKEAT